MWLTLYAPGTRKGNTHWIARGGIGDREFEVSTRTQDKGAAEKIAADYLKDFAHDDERDGDQLPESGRRDVTYAEASRAWRKGRDLGNQDIVRLDRLEASRIGATLCDAILSEDLKDLAKELQPDLADETRNRDVITPASAVLHYAADKDWCENRRFKRFKVPRKSRRRPARDEDLRRLLAEIVARAEAAERKLAIGIAAGGARRQRQLAGFRRLKLETLIAATPYRRLLLMMLYETGLRLDDHLQLDDDHLELMRARLWVSTGKADEPAYVDLSRRLVAELRRVPRIPRSEEGKGGWVLPWRTRSGVYKWLRPLCRHLRITYTPHMSRHAFVTEHLMDGHHRTQVARWAAFADERSVDRYTHGHAPRPGKRGANVLLLPVRKGRRKAVVSGDASGERSKKADRS